jgi:pyruvate/2-oxoglutarate dehydrogenase complex dihydrolipoamide dehydrogenase (E3) component
LKQAHYDLVILGSGSTAFAAALRAQALGKTSVMTEERTTGGTCVNRGCLPSKNLIEAAKIIHDALHPHGVCTAEENVGVLLCPTNCSERGRRRTQRKEISPQRH